MSAHRHESERLLHAASDSPRPSQSDDDTLTGEGSVDYEQMEHDRKLLEEEEEREELLVGGKRQGRLQRLFSGADQNSPKKNKKSKRRTRREKLRSSGDEVSELMYEMEEGGEPSASDDSSRGSSESDAGRLRLVQEEKTARASRKKRITRRILMFGGIFILFLALLLAAYKATKVSDKPIPLKFSNGTANFAATTILISLDGFRADFLTRGLTPTMNSFVKNGVSPKYMNPSFPSLTFPNHYTLVTGLYPEAHGIVGNTFWDPAFKEEFFYTHPSQSMQPKWWGGEPLWETAEKRGLRTAIHMWPGSEAHIGTVEPAYVDKFNGSEELSVKVNRILGLLDLPGPDVPAARADQPRPQLIAAYVPNVDADGHKYGPNSTEIRSTIQKVDNMLHDLFEGLEQRNLTNIVNVVVVSDHGMATTDVTRLIQLDDLVDPNLLEHIDGWPLYGLRPKNPADLDGMYQQIKERTKDNPNIDVYLRDKDMPERYHFTNNDRIAPLWLVPKTGWAIVKKAEFDVQKAIKDGTVYSPRGLHGYDHEHPLMRAIFIARGPAFPHLPGSRVEAFQNIELYNIICDSLEIEPMPNNGTLRLPFKTIGLHDDPGAPTDEIPSDPPASSSPSVTAQPATSDVPAQSRPTVAATPTLSPIPLSQSSNPATSVKVPSSHTDIPAPPDNAGAGQGQEGNPMDDPDFWKWFFDKWQAAKDWAGGVFDKIGDKISASKAGGEPPAPAA